MRYVFLVLCLLAVMVGLITWAARPDLFELQYNRVAAPIEQHFAAKRAAAWQAAKEQAWQQWQAHMRLPGDCAQPATSLRSVECKNQLQQQAYAFERAWANQIASGWRPDGAE